MQPVLNQIVLLSVPSEYMYIQTKNRHLFDLFKKRFEAKNATRQRTRQEAIYYRIISYRSTNQRMQMVKKDKQRNREDA